TLGKRRFIHSIRHCERSVAIQLFDIKRTSGLPRRYAPRNDDLICVSLGLSWLPIDFAQD
ncbi:MAG: hypothetical protein Q7T21_13095, partial [Gallionella sp.]|nr:hypothetical protein [Gallionella sp.]